MDSLPGLCQADHSDPGHVPLIEVASTELMLVFFVAAKRHHTDNMSENNQCTFIISQDWWLDSAVGARDAVQMEDPLSYMCKPLGSSRPCIAVLPSSYPKSL